jgi:hypothetical protein
MTEEEYAREMECSWDSIIGKRIYPEFKYEKHVAHNLQPSSNDELTIYRGWDNTGLNPGVVLTYITSTGQWIIFKEFSFFNVGIMDATEAVVLWCNRHMNYRCKYVDYADPAGKNRDSVKMSARDYIVIKSREMGREIQLIDGVQTFKVRRESVANRLSSLINGEPALLVDAKGCPGLVEGFEGAYAYKEISHTPGEFKQEAIKNRAADLHDALQYVGTRLFLSMGRTSNGSLLPEIDQFDNEFSDYEYHDNSTGRSTITGY